MFQLTSECLAVSFISACTVLASVLCCEFHVSVITTMSDFCPWVVSGASKHSRLMQWHFESLNCYNQTKPGYLDPKITSLSPCRQLGKGCSYCLIYSYKAFRVTLHICAAPAGVVLC